eukprot:3457731-Amphidinium_carterae.1
MPKVVIVLSTIRTGEAPLGTKRNFLLKVRPDGSTETVSCINEVHSADVIIGKSLGCKRLASISSAVCVIERSM